MLRFSKCDVKVSEKFSLKEIDWQIEPRQVWVIVGPNGSGKSALGAAVSGEFQITEGHFECDSSIALVSLEEQARLIQRERERNNSDLTDEIDDGTSVDEILSENSKNPILLAQLIESFGMSPLLARGFRKLSTGESRKVLLIRAITSCPEILVLDEPYEGLDAETVPKILKVSGTGTS